ncbi:thiopeptide-type bacteriocin biosynthesis protein [Enhygromyxa salina]|uniref:Thiopeptide-type bacteriocin biosynthesis domain-containing protein n=1 Tax=Enhygromyxa salina TaxID=215803 RepID=A0A2S9YT60_9BACT|nr:thiopeptide-type bacteriocin biosynthesis protein [Enhygromyxa salina]PRQ08305.1 hypothetical protein ENSA7_19280 [Enhygromyxa salina]
MTDPWLYLQLFHEDPADADTILTDFVATTSRELLGDASVDRFFFLRYFEGGHHIRYRLRVTDPTRLDALHDWLRVRARDTPSIGRIERAAYERELHKHGGAAGLEIAERQFFASSQFALSCIEATAADPQRRALIGLGALDVLLRRAGLDRAARRRCSLAYAAHWSALLARGMDEWAPASPDPAQVELARAWLERADGGLWSRAAHSADVDRRGDVATAQWLESVRDEVAALRALDSQGRLDVPMQVVLWNLIHTLNNRLGLGIGAEVAIATLASVVHALPARPTLPVALDTDRPNAIWAEVVEGLASGRPTAVAVDGDVDSTLVEWRAQASKLGARWVVAPRDEPDGPQPFALWRRLARGYSSDGADRLDRQLADARQPWSDPECPMLPDPQGVYDVIAAFLLSASTEPTIIVVRDVAAASPECLAALSTIVLRRCRGAAVLVLVADADLTQGDSVPGRRWVQLVRQLHERAGLHHLRLPGGPAAPRTPDPSTLTDHARVGLDMCRAGALTTGVHHLATAISREPSHGADPEILVHLAMATLQLRELDLAAQAAEAAYRVGPSPHRQRARRVWMATMHTNDDAEGLERLGADVQHDLEQAERSSQQHAWLLLDAALCTALRMSRRDEHVRYLDAIITKPVAIVPRQCLATAHIWRAAPWFTQGQLAEALPHQRAGVQLLETLSDPTRLLFTRLRLGGTLAQLGAFDQAAKLFEEVTAASLCQGGFDTALDAASRAVLGYIEAEQPLAAAALLHSAEPTVRHMWSQSPSVTLLCELALALARDDHERVRAIVVVFPPPLWTTTLVDIPDLTAKRMAAIDTSYAV